MPDQPDHRPTFFFRSDFALESGFVDNLRREVSSQEFARLRQETGAGPFSWQSLVAYNQTRAATPAPRFLMASGLIRPGETTPISGLCDGKTWFFPDPKCGLFADLLARVAVVAPPKKGGASQVMPAALAEPRKRWVPAEFAVLHDAETSTAEVMAWSAAYSAVQNWIKSQ